MSIAVGIDLGTTNSAISYIKDGNVQMIPIEGKNTFPSVIAVRNGEILSGQQAKSRLLIAPDNTVSSSKRDIGEDITYNLGGKIFTPEDIAFHILSAMKEKAESYLKEEIKEAVITVPAYFTSEQRERTMNAGKRAGFNVLRLIPEPTAAALDYGMEQDKNQTIMVYDLGGGTFDISIMRVEENDFEILTVVGDSKLGGDDFSNVITNILCQKVNRDLGIIITLQKEKKYISAITKLKEAAERAKIDLSELMETEIIIPNLIDDYCFEKVIRRSEFNDAAKPLVDRTLEKVDSALKILNFTSKDIDKVILVGGSTKMPIIRESVEEKIKEPYMASNVDEVVARGAAIMAVSLSNPDYKKKSGIDLSKKIAVKEKAVFTYGVDMLNSHGELKFNPIIKKGTLLPAVNGIIGSTSREYQNGVLLNVYRGESLELKENEYLGELSFDIKNPVREMVPVLALFEIDNNMIIRFRSVQIPTTKEYLKLIENDDIKGLKYCLDSGKLRATEVIIDGKKKEKNL